MGTEISILASCRLLPITFGRKELILEDFGEFSCIVVYNSIESVLFDSKSHTNILRNGDFMGLGSIYGSRMKESTK